MRSRPLLSEERGLGVAKATTVWLPQEGVWARLNSLFARPYDGARRVSMPASTAPFLRRVGLRFDDLPQRVEVVVEGDAALGSELQPRAGPLADVTFADGDVPGLFERRRMTGQNRVAELQGVPKEPELELVGLGQAGEQGETHGLMNQVVEPRSGVGRQAFLLSRSAHKSSGAAAEDAPQGSGVADGAVQ